ncbi:unnamed protein product [Brachionus calyciflorus]|uniref:Caspase family p20 domain-containing protein n=1 Tax=Brachionus calyciflorus TaxID=104777 RepID=A0A813V5L2_9BILA|nr:unnamed protein product [Brachionus calyciflorus]
MTSSYYQIDYLNPGKVLIFANSIFDNPNINNLNYVQVDVDNIYNLFNNLNYNVKKFENKTTEEIRKIISDKAKNDYTSYSSFICFLTSHGSYGDYLAKDGDISISEFINLFKNVESLQGKPKLFFIDACRILNHHMNIDKFLESLVFEARDIGSDDYIKIWNASDYSSNKEIEVSDRPRVIVICLEIITFNQNYLISGSDNSEIKIWSIPDYRLVKTLNDHVGTIRCIKKIRNEIFASGSDDKTIKIWSSEKDKPLKTINLKTINLNSRSASCIQLIDHNNLSFASGDYDSTVNIWRFKI